MNLKHIKVIRSVSFISTAISMPLLICPQRNLHSLVSCALAKVSIRNPSTGECLLDQNKSQASPCGTRRAYSWLRTSRNTRRTKRTSHSSLLLHWKFEMQYMFCLSIFTRATLASTDIGSRPSDHYFRSVRLFVCLFVCAEFFSAVFDPISIKLGHMLYVWV